jgi:pimeloyl-ACP methyl ester carboxylesterase
MHADLPGVRLWYTDTGGTGTPIVLLHANTGTSANWQAQNEAFSGAGYRVIAFDRRGWGRSFPEPKTGPQPGTVAEDLHALAGHLKLDRFHLVGVAGGGFIALDYAAWQQEKLLSLIVGASTGSMSDAPEAAFRERILSPGFRALPAHYRELGPSYLGENPEGVKEWIDIEHHARQSADSPQPGLRSPNTYAKIARIEVPALLLLAGADLIAPPALMKQWGSHLPNVEFAEVFDAGHSIAWERPELFNRRILDFLKRREAAGR